MENAHFFSYGMPSAYKHHLLLYQLIILTCFSTANKTSTLQLARLTNALQRQGRTSTSNYGDGYGGRGITINPILFHKPATVIVLHGLGGSADDWSLFAMAVMFLDLNYCKFILPSADVAPVSYQSNRKMPSWFNVFGVREGAKEDKAGLLKSSNRIYRIIQGEIKKGVPSDRIFVMGFSQGGALALTIYMRSPYKLAGLIAVSTWLPLVSIYPAELSKATAKTPILFMNGVKDEAVPIKMARKSVKVLRKLKRKVFFVTYPNQAHIIFDKSVALNIQNFIKRYAPGPTRIIQNTIKKIAKQLTFKSPF